MPILQFRRIGTDVPGVPDLRANTHLRSAVGRTRKVLSRLHLSVLAEMHYQVILDSLHEGVMFIDPSGNTLHCNPATERILGVSAHLIQGLSSVDPEHFRALKEDGSVFGEDEHPSRVALRSGQPCLGVVQGLPRAGNAIQWISVNAVPLKGPHGQVSGVVASLVDITPIKLLQERLQNEATRDPLTGLANRRCYLENLTKAFHGARRHGHPMSVAYCDLDHLKAINDAHGHAAGDQVIRAFGRVVADALRREDLAARFGGDEFCLLFTHVGAAESRICLSRVLAHVNELELTLSNGATLNGFTASAGLADLKESHAHPDDVLAAADQALYRAKQEGRDRLVIA